MRIILIALSLLCLFSCETKYNYIDTGLAQEKFDGNTWEYLHSNHYDWDSVIVMIERAGMVDLFEGQQAGYEEFTFLGPTNFSILRYMMRNNLESISQIPVEDCQDFIKRHVIAGVHERDSIARGEKLLGMVQGNGGEVMTTLAGSQLWVYTIQGSYEDIPDVGAVEIHVTSLETQTETMVASSNIKTNTGVVHSLSYNYTLGEL